MNKKLLFFTFIFGFCNFLISQTSTLIKNDTSFLVSVSNLDQYDPSNNRYNFLDGIIKDYYNGSGTNNNITQTNPNPGAESEIIIDFKRSLNLSKIDFLHFMFGSDYFRNGVDLIKIQTSNSSNGPWVDIKYTSNGSVHANSSPSSNMTKTSFSIDQSKISRYYRFVMRGWWQGISYKYSYLFTEIQFSEKPSINSTSSKILNKECVTLSTSASGETYLWSTGETTQSIQVCDAGTYTCQVTNTSFTGNQDYIASITIDKIESQDSLPSPNGEVYSIFKNGNTVYYGGDFNTVGPITGSGSGIDNKSGLPNTALPRINGTINATISDNNGGWYVGGVFTKVGNYAISNLAHIKADNSVDTTFKPAPNGAVNTLLLNGSSFYIGGAFTSIQGITNNYVAKIDKSNGSAILWNAQCNGIVRSLALAADQLVVGGDFTAIGGQTRNYLATVDTVYVQASTWNPAPNNKVYKVYSTGTKLYVGGDFTTISGVAKGNGAGYSLPAFTIDGYNMGANGRIHDFILNNNILYAAGLFTTIGGANRNYLAGLNPLNTIANSFNATAEGIVRTLAISGGNLIVGGDFANIGGETRSRIAALDFTTGVATSWNPTIVGEKLINPTVNTIATFGNTIYTAGTFYSVGAVTRNNAAAIDATTGQILPWNPNTNGIVRAIAADNNNVYLGGDFTTVNGSITKNRIAQVNASTGIATGWTPNSDNTVNALLLQGNLLYTGGNFANIGGAARSKIAILSTVSGSASAFNPTANGNVNALAISGDTLYLGGDFTTIGGQTRNRLASYQISNSTLLAFNPNVNATVSALAVNKSKLYVGGAFSLIGSKLRYNLAEIDVTTGNATSLNTNVINGSSINTLAIQDSSVYCGGGYQYYNSGQPISNLATVKTQSGLLGYWQPQPNDIVRAICLSSNKVYVGGRFKQINSRYQPYFASLDIYNSGNPPTITSVPTTSGCIGTALTVNGTGFVNVTDVQIGTTSVPFVVNSTTSLLITPSTSLSGKVKVINVIGSPVSTETVTINALPNASISVSGTNTVCEGNTVTLNANTGSSLTYKWFNNAVEIQGATSSLYSASTSGDYTVQVTNSNNCSALSSVQTVTINPKPQVSVSADGPTTMCQGTKLNLTANTNAQNAYYSWKKDGQYLFGTVDVTAQTKEVSTDGKYTVEVNSNGCITESSTILVKVNPLPTAEVTNLGLFNFCEGTTSTLKATLYNTNLGSVYTYSWQKDGQAINSNLSSLVVNSTGFYNYKVTDDNNCSTYSLPVNIKVNQLPDAIISSSSSITFCQGGNVTLSSSSANSYLWSTGATTSSIIVNLSGNYTVKVTDANGCQNKSLATVVTVNSLPTVSITPNGNTTFCQGNTVMLTSSTASSYLWSTGETTQAIVVSNLGNYSVKLTDINGCQNTSTITTVKVNPLPSANVTSNGKLSYCQGETISVSLVSSNGSSYLWSNGATTSSISPTISGDYSVQVTDANGCKNTSTATVVSLNSLPTATVTASGTTTFCQGESVTLTSSSSNSYLWSTGETSVSISPTIAGDYSVQVTDANGCKNTSTATVVTVNTLPTAIITAGGATTFCQGGSVTLTSSSGNSYLWSTGATTASITTTIGGDYTVQITDANGCKNTSEATDVSVNALPKATITASGATTFCQGESVTLTSSSGNSYLWSTGATTASITPTIAGDYTVQITDANGCKNTTTATVVSVNTLPTATITTSGATTFCQGESVTLTSSSSNSYLWSTGETSASITPTTGGDYTVQVTDANGCKNTSVATVVSVNSLPTATITASGSTTFCQGGSVTLTSSIGSSYLWSNGATTASITSTLGGDYAVQVTDANGCKNTSTATVVSVNSLPTATITASGASTICQGGSVTLTSSSGSSYLWSTGSTTASITPTLAGNYTVQVTDANGCKNTSNATIVSVNTLPTATITAGGATAFCQGGSVTLTSSTGSSYLWSTGATTASITPTIGGAYTVEVTDAIGCKNTSVATVVSVSALPTATITASGSTTFCQGENVALTSSNGNSYLWSTGATTASISPTISGNYTVQVVDANGCKNTSTATVVSVNALPTATITASGATAFCQGGSVTLTSSGGNSYLWSTGATTASITPTIGGEYTVQVTDLKGCKNTSIAKVVSINPLPTVVISATKTSICSGENITLIGSGALTYSWDNSITNGLSFKPTTTTTYTVVGRDNNGCVGTSSVTILVNQPPIVQISSNVPSNKVCFGGDLELSTKLGGSYTWSSGEVSQSIYPSKSGVYSLKYTDLNGCTSSSNAIKVTVYPLPKVSLTVNGPVTYCKNQSSELVSSTGVSYLWNDGSITKSIKPTSSGDYSVKVTDLNGCSATSESVSLTVNNCASIDELGFNLIRVYPNPTLRELNVDIPSTFIDFNYKVIDLAGKELIRGQLNSIKNSIDLQEITSGYYFLEIENGYRMKFIKE